MNPPSTWFALLQLLLGAGGVLLLLAIAVLLVVLLFRRGGRRKSKEVKLEVKRLGDRLEENEAVLRAALLGRKELKAWHKEREEAAKARRKAHGVGDGQGNTSGAAAKPRVFVVDFEGDIQATQVESLREQVTAILAVAAKGDEVVVRLESPGGVVHSYGLAASQLERVRRAGLALTVCVDRVAASGGYMMACIGSRVLAAPFAILGSIGVVASMPNVNRALKKHDVDWLELTAGEYKRTLTPFGEITEGKKEKFLAQLEEIHHQFKEFVGRHRPSLDLARVATGEHWLGARAKELGLVDDILTSDDYLVARCKEAEVLLVGARRQETFAARLQKLATARFLGA